MMHSTYICQNCWATVTVERDGADLVFTAEGSTIRFEGVAPLGIGQALGKAPIAGFMMTAIGKLAGRSQKTKLEYFVSASHCPACIGDLLG